MQVVDLNYFIDLGASLEEAASIDPKGELFAAYFRLFKLSALLRKLKGGQQARLNATFHDLGELMSAIDSFEKRHFRDKEGKWRSPDDSERSEYELSALISKIGQFRTVLTADLRVAAAFSVMRAGIFDVNALVNNAHEALGDLATKKLDHAVLLEIDASGKCLAFNLSTASGFHAMRAVERVIKSYLALFLSPDDIIKMSNWGQYLSALEKAAARESQLKPSQEAISLIRQIKDIYRNPVIHPERVLTTDEAGTLFHSTIAAVTRIGIELDEGQRELPGLITSKRAPSTLVDALLDSRAA